MNMKKIAIAVVSIFSFIGIFGYIIASSVDAEGDHKEDICHYDGRSGRYQTLNIASEAVEAHLKKDDRDYRGECKEEKKASINIDRPTLTCGENKVKFEGGFEPTRNTYVKFTINDRHPEVSYGEGRWWTGELTLPVNDYKIKAELYWRSKRGDKVIASQEGKFTLNECEPEITPTPQPEPTPVETITRGFSTPEAPKPPSCESPKYAPTVTYLGESGGVFSYEWTEVDPNVNTYWINYGATADNLDQSVVVEGEYIDINMFGGSSNWMEVAGYDNGCTGPFSAITN